MVDKIKEGELVIIPTGFNSSQGCHNVAIMFYENQFVICNRGYRIPGTPVVQSFNYDKDKINLDVLKYIFINSNSVIESTAEEGSINQYLTLEAILPKILNAKRIDEPITNIDFQDQKISNCTKSSPLTAIKMAIYLKKIKEGCSYPEASLIAKNLGDEISIKLRTKSIEEIKEFSKGLTSSFKQTLNFFINKATNKLNSKKLSKFSEILTKSDIEELTRITSETTASKKTYIADKNEDNPLLLLIAKQRKNIGPEWNPDNLRSMPYKFDRCKNQFKSIDDGEALTITDADKKIFQFLIKKLYKLGIKDIAIKDVLTSADFIQLSGINTTIVETSEPADLKHHHPLLLLIARQRKNIGPEWKPDQIKGLSINREKCKEIFDFIGGVKKNDEQDPLEITDIDKKIFQYLIDKIGID